MAGITIPIATDTRQAVKETNDLAKGFDKVADSLDDVEKNSRGADKLESNLRDAQKETKQTTDAFEKLADAQRRANESGRDFGTGTTRGLRDVGETSKEVGGELKQNIGETFSSFRGDAQDLGQVFQDTLGGLASGLEGIPAIAAVAAGAAGIGLILGAIENGQQQSEQWKQDVADLTTQFIEAGKSGRGLDDLVDKLKELASTGDDAGVTLKQLNDLSSRSKTSYEDVAQAYAGNTSALKDLVQAGKDRVKQLVEESGRIDTNSDADRKRYAGLIDQIQAQNQLNDYMQQASDKAQEAAKNAKLYAQSGAAELQQKADLVKSIDDAYDEAAGSVDDYVNAETGVFDVDKYIAAMQAKAAALDAYKSNLQKATLTLTPEALAFVESQGEAVGSTMVQGYLAANPQQQASLNAIWTTNGKTSANSYVGSINANMPKTVQGPTPVINDVDTSRIPGLIQQTLNGHRFTVPVWANVRVGNAVN